MKVTSYETNEEWLEARRGRITGSSLKNIIVKRGTEMKKGFYELIADRISIPRDENERPMDRGTELECESIAIFEKETGKKVDTSLVIWSRDENENIAISPDGSIGDTEAVESKSLNSASHIEAYIKQEVPSEYEEQVIQYFIVNDSLTTLYFLFYDPSLLVKQFFYLTVTRKDVQEKVDTYLEFQRKTLEEVEKRVSELTF